jgi:hypothetical protein
MTSQKFPFIFNGHQSLRKSPCNMTATWMTLDVLRSFFIFNHYYSFPKSPRNLTATSSDPLQLAQQRLRMIQNVGYRLDISDVLYHTGTMMMTGSQTQQERALSLLSRQGGMARLSELSREGITAATLTRMREKGLILQPSRGLYQLPDAGGDTNHALAEAAKLVPKGVICLVSALAFHQLTDTIPRCVWMAIGPKDRRPAVTQPPLQIVRFRDKMLEAGIEEHRIEGVTVGIYNVPKTVADLFRYRQSAGKRYKNSPGLNLALEGLREALRQRKATPAEIAEYANDAGIWKIVEPYLQAMTANA